MGLRINQNIDGAQLLPQPVRHPGPDVASRWRSCRRASASTAPPTTRPAWRSPRACARRSAASRSAVRNAQDGISVVQTAEGALTEVHSILQRMRDLVGAGGNNGSQNTDVAGRTARTSSTQLHDRDRPDRGQHQVQRRQAARRRRTRDASRSASRQRRDTIDDRRRTATRRCGHRRRWTSTAVDHRRGSDADRRPRSRTVSTQRAELGAVQNRFEHTINNLNVAVENLSASESRIRDTDMAQEMVSFTRSQILSQAGTAMLAQANQAPQGVLPCSADRARAGQPAAAHRRPDGPGRCAHRARRHRRRTVRRSDEEEDVHGIGQHQRPRQRARHRGDHRPAHAARGAPQTPAQEPQTSREDRRHRAAGAQHQVAALATRPPSLAKAEHLAGRQGHLARHRGRRDHQRRRRRRGTSR